jgi:methylthioribose-1-phosphate isomerase
MLDAGPEAVLAKAQDMLDTDDRVNVAAGNRAADLLLELCGSRALTIATHCNTGRLATGGEGTALGTIKRLAERGYVSSVLVGETRPLLQGARLTAWELGEADIAHHLCVDSAMPAAIARGMVDCVVVGADRIAANGDVANKIGTYSLAVAAARSGVPFVVVAPESSIDRGLADGALIEIEARDGAEVLELGGQRIAPAGTAVYNPAFDVTPAELVTAVVSESAVYVGEIAARPTSVRGDADARAYRGVVGGRGVKRVEDLHAQEAELVAVATDLYSRGWMEGTSGNVSIRFGDGHALITASGRGKGRLTRDDTVLVRLSDAAPARPGSCRPSAETAIHAALYGCVADCGAVVHAHCPYATAYASRVRASSEVVIARIVDYELIKGLGVVDAGFVNIPVFPNWADVSRIAADVARYLSDGGGGDSPVLLIARHGATAWGPQLDDARDRLECLEALCRLEFLAASVRG